jgi:hypothetical protein
MDYKAAFTEVIFSCSRPVIRNFGFRCSGASCGEVLPTFQCTFQTLPSGGTGGRTYVRLHRPSSSFALRMSAANLS